MMSSRLTLSVLIQVVILVGGFSARGENIVAVSNLQTPPPVSSIVPAGGFLAQPFTTGEAASLAGVQMYLSYWDPRPASVLVSLYSDGNGHPGASLVSFAGPTSIDSASFALYTFTNTVPFDLAASTRYWVVVNSTTFEHYLWAGSEDAPYPGLPGWSISENAVFGPGGGGLGLGKSQLAVIIAVPEPATITFGYVALAGCMFVNWRKGSLGRR